MAPVDIILDTDIALDVDDAGTIALLHALENKQECRLLAVCVNTSSQVPDGLYAAQCVSAINTFYGRSGIPIGIFHGPNIIPERVGQYASKVAAHFPHSVKSANDLPHAWKLYRQVLAAQPDHSVTIISIGFLNNLRDLLMSPPDECSKLDGTELVRTKVKQLVCMGGRFPDGDEEFNFNTYYIDTQYVLEQWPVRAVFSGSEFGCNVLTGKVFAKTYKIHEHPVAMSYHYYNGGENRESWDQLTALFAVRGESAGFKTNGPGLASAVQIGQYIPNVLYKSKNTWEADPKGMHYYITPTRSFQELADEIDDLMIDA